uniref:Uncharacterized protein n=1 Tax=Kalanchoe fedtschenkoi TaxID=63787 RepID=A0A7N0RJM0_KALFE
MASKLSLHLASRLILSKSNSSFSSLRHRPPISTFSHFKSSWPLSSAVATIPVIPHNSTVDISSLRFFSTSRRPAKPTKVDIGARARQMQTRRLWTYALAFSGIAVFVTIVLNQFQDQLVFYVTPTDALEKYTSNPTKNRFRLGGLVLEGSVVYPESSPEMEFVVTDLITDVLVKYQGSLPDLFREGHSVVVEGFIKPMTGEIRKEESAKKVSEKARTLDCYFSASDVLAKHDEKYMPQEVAQAIEKNKTKLAEAAAAVAAEGEAATVPPN